MQCLVNILYIMAYIYQHNKTQIHMYCVYVTVRGPKLFSYLFLICSNYSWP